MHMDIAHPYLIFLGDVQDQLAAKTALGIVDWRRDWCLGQMRLAGCKADARLPDMSITHAAAKGARTFVIGVANAGGVLPEHWVATIVAAIETGMDVASGLHVRLGDVPAIADAASKHGRQLFDVRHTRQRFETGKGVKRSGLRLLTVGTDCSAGKKYTALSLERAMRAAGFDAHFKATGQTGVFISGRGVAIDAIVADFISGAVEWLSPEMPATRWDIIEGQGSLFHPSFAGVTLGLLHGAQPDAFVVCHEPTRKTMRGVPAPLPTIGDVIHQTLALGRLTNPAIRCVGIAINTEALDENEARRLCDEAARLHGLPASDPVRFGLDGIVARIGEIFPTSVDAGHAEVA
jgi:uncharacterized NAD-dependent epimerase/dehydratase family protein